MKTDYSNDFDQMQSSFMSSSTARKYAEGRSLAWQQLEIGYNAFKGSRFSYLRGCITFPLKDQQGRIVSLYGRSVRNNDKSKHYYTSNRKGLYPGYPKLTANKVILTESVIDAAVLVQQPALQQYEVLALYGTNGLTSEHIHSLQQLEHLEEIILFFDGDEAGQKATQKHAEYLQQLFKNVLLSMVTTPEYEDINSLFITYNANSLKTLLKERTFFATSSFQEKTTKPAEKNKPESFKLQTTNPHNITYTTATAHYQIKGGVRQELDSLKVTLVIEHLEAKIKSRSKLDLYEDKQTRKISQEAAEKLQLRADLIEEDLSRLTDLLDEYREESSSLEKQATKKVIVSSAEKEKCFSFLKKPGLLDNINELIGKSGVVGEENNRLFLFVIASTYKMQETLHALIQGTSGSGKTHLLKSIMEFMPPEDTLRLTRVTESSFYNYGRYELQNKLIGMEDFDGLEEKAELAFRELQSKGMISSSTSGKNESTGKMEGFVKEVYGPIASLSATTKGEIYEDNMSRCFLISVDESHQQTRRIINYQNNKAAGEIDGKKEKEIRSFLRNCIRLLRPMEVINPYANKIELPDEAHKVRRLNELFQSFIKQVTLLNQYQRNKDPQGRLITLPEDVKTAIDIMFDSIILKVDELDGSLRSFYEQLKSYVLDKGKDSASSPTGYEFEQREIRQAFRISKTQMHRYIQNLMELEYVAKTYVSARNTFHYKIMYWDNLEALRGRIKEDLNKQLEQL